MKKNKTYKQRRKNYVNKLKRTRKLINIKYDFSKIHPASIIINRK